MKILIYGLNYAPEPIGIGRYTGEMAQWLAARGHDVRVVTAPPYYPAWRLGEGYRGWCYGFERMAGVRIARCPLWVPIRRSGLNRLLHLASFAVTSFPIVLGQALTFRPDVVLSVAPALACAPGGWLAAGLARLVGGGGKGWLHIQDFEVDAAFDLGLLRSPYLRRLALAVERFLLGRFDVVSTITAPMREKLMAKGVGEENTVLFPNWADTEKIRPMPADTPEVAALGAELAIPKTSKVALYAGNIGEKQGLEILVEAARLLEPRTDILLLVCGDGAAASRLAGLARGLDNIRFLPLQDEPRFNALLNLAAMHLLPQRAAAEDLVMPSKLGPMLASGRPVVAMAEAGTGIAEAVKGCGLVVVPQNALALAEAVEKLVDDTGMAEKLGRRARKRAETEWNGQKILERLETALLALT